MPAHATEPSEVVEDEAARNPLRIHVLDDIATAYAIQIMQLNPSPTQEDIEVAFKTGYKRGEAEFRQISSTPPR